jgi:hypothetical protein
MAQHRAMHWFALMKGDEEPRILLEPGHFDALDVGFAVCLSWPCSDNCCVRDLSTK